MYAQPILWTIQAVESISCTYSPASYLISATSPSLLLPAKMSIQPTIIMPIIPPINSPLPTSRFAFYVTVSVIGGVDVATVRGAASTVFVKRNPALIARIFLELFIVAV